MESTLHLLSTKNKSDDDRKLKIQHFAQSLTTVKNPKNVWLLINKLALSPDLLTSPQICVYLCDAFIYVCQRKQQISDPTISFLNLQKILNSLVYNLPPLLSLIILTSLQSPDLVVFANKVCERNELVPFVCFVLTRCDLPFENYKNLNCDQIVNACLQIVFSGFEQKELGTLSKLLKHVLAFASFKCLDFYLNVLSFHVVGIKNTSQNVDLQSWFFAILIQLEGVTIQMFRRYPKLAIRVLQVLQVLAFIGQKIGTQFESYMFVFNGCLDCLVVQKDVSNQILLLQNCTDNTELVFLFEVTEQLMAHLNAQLVETSILPLAQKFLTPQLNFNLDLFESSHSLFLAFLSTHHSLRFSKRQVSLQYFNEVMNLFPKFLKGVQLRTAVLTITSTLQDTDVEFVLQRVFNAVKQSIPGTLIEGDIPTVRSALISTLLHCVQSKFHGVRLQQWLELITSTVPQPFSPETKIERQFLLKDFASLATNGDDELVYWWFRNFKGRL